jgi:FkbM family methyltransferase
MKQLAKQLLTSTIFRTGSVRRVLFGPSRGLRYRIFPGFGHAYLYGNWEPVECRCMQKFVRPGTVAYDLGANYGMHTLLLARLVGAEGKVYAFEPDTEVRAALIEQMALNRFTQAFIQPEAITDHDGFQYWEPSASSATAHLSDQGKRRVPVTTLDSFVFNAHNPPPAFIKIDVEGAESAVLAGARRVIETYRPAMAIELHTPEQDRLVGTTLETYGYSAYRIAGHHYKFKVGARVKNMRGSHPDPDGMWGTVLALHGDREGDRCII